MTEEHEAPSCELRAASREPDTPNTHHRAPNTEAQPQAPSRKLQGQLSFPRSSVGMHFFDAPRRGLGTRSVQERIATRSVATRSRKAASCRRSPRADARHEAPSCELRAASRIPRTPTTEHRSSAASRVCRVAHPASGGTHEPRATSRERGGDDRGPSPKPPFAYFAVMSHPCSSVCICG